MFEFFDNLFDTNHDGKLDTFEKSSQIAAMTYLLNQEDEERLKQEADELEEELENRKDELEEVGLNVIDLEFMDEEDRNEAIEAAGLDPMDYEDDF